jgi:RES domain-containing protein
MLVYRISLARFGNNLLASGRAARWSPNDVKMIYTASSRSLACLENVVHRNRAGLTDIFNIMTISCPEDLKIKTIPVSSLSDNWADYDQMYLTQRMGEIWIRENSSAILEVPSSAILEVPSSIVEGEVNYLLNPEHADFKKITIIKTQPFVFDKRIKE